MIIVIPGAYNAQTGVVGGNIQGQTITVGAILKVTERDRRPYPTDSGSPSEIWIDNTSAIGYICKENGPTGTVWDRLDLLGDYIAFGDGNPGSNADITWGYRPGSLRYARNTQTLWICDDNTQGAAIWSVLGGGGSTLTLQTNGIVNGDQTLLNIVQGSNMIITDDGLGNITFDSTGSSNTVNNALTENPVGNFQFGGTLVKDTDLINSGFYLKFTQSSGKPLELYSNNAEALLAQRANVSRNTVDTVLRLTRQSTTNPLGIWTQSGFGESIDFDLMLSNGSTVTASKITSSWDSPISPNERSYLKFATRRNGVLSDKLLINDFGVITLASYGSGTITDTLAYSLGVNSSGDIIEYTPSTGGGDMFKAVYDTDNDGIVDKAERIEIIVRNSTGSTLTKGQIVYLSGATGNRPNALLADASTEATSSKTIGMVVADILNNADGNVAVNGTLHDLATNMFSDGDTLWLDTTPGGMVANTPPAEPNHAVFIGYVARAHPTQGRIVLAIQNGYELNELHGVLINSEANNDLLVYETSSTLWKNKSLSTAYPNIVTGSFGVTVDGVTTVVQIGQVGFVVIPYSGTITGWSITANAVGSIQFDVWKAAGAIPTIANTIVAGAFPTLTAGQFVTSTTLTGWTTAFAAGDVFGFYVNSASTIKNATLTLRTTKS